MTAGFEWKNGQSPEDVFMVGFDAYTEDIEKALLELAQSYASRIEAWMKANAPWTDRTGLARITLGVTVLKMRGFDIDSETQEATVDHSEGKVIMYISHGMKYGVYLELNHQGRFAIIQPALEHFAPQIWADVEALFK